MTIQQMRAAGAKRGKLAKRKGTHSQELEFKMRKENRTLAYICAALAEAA